MATQKGVNNNCWQRKKENKFEFSNSSIQVSTSFVTFKVIDMY